MFKRPFWQLLRKEMRQSLPAIGFVVVVLAIFYSLPYLLRWVPSQEFMALLFMPLSFLPFWILWRSIAVWRREWGGNHMLLLLSLPVRGWQITGAKLLAVFLEMLLYIVVITAGSYLTWTPRLIRTDLPPSMYGLMIIWLGYAMLLSSLVVLSVCLIGQFSYLAARLSPRFQGLAQVAAFAVALWGAFRMGGWLSPLFQWLPRIPFVGLDIGPGEINRQIYYIQVAPVVGALVVLGGVFWLASLWVERDLEV